MPALGERGPGPANHRRTGLRRPDAVGLAVALVRLGEVLAPGRARSARPGACRLAWGRDVALFESSISLSSDLPSGVAADGAGEFPMTRVHERAALLLVGGKLRGSRARSLGERLADLADAGLARVVLDLRTLTSIDSLGTFALEEGLDRGLRLHLVVRASFEFDEFFASRSLGRRGLRVHRSLDEALGRVRQVMDSQVFA